MTDFLQFSISVGDNLSHGHITFYTGDDHSGRRPEICVLVPDNKVSTFATSNRQGLKLIRKVRVLGVSGFQCLLMKFGTVDEATNFVNYINHNYPPAPPFENRRFQDKSYFYAYFIKVVYSSTGIVWHQISDGKCSRCSGNVSGEDAKFVPLCGHPVHLKCTKYKLSEVFKTGNADTCGVCRSSFFQTEELMRCICGSRTNIWFCEGCTGIYCVRGEMNHVRDHFLQSEHVFFRNVDQQLVWNYQKETYTQICFSNSSLSEVSSLCIHNNETCGLCSEGLENANTPEEKVMETIHELERKLFKQKRDYEKDVFRVLGKTNKLVLEQKEHLEISIKEKLNKLSLEIDKSKKIIEEQVKLNKRILELERRNTLLELLYKAQKEEEAMRAEKK